MVAAAVQKIMVTEQMLVLVDFLAHSNFSVILFEAIRLPPLPPCLPPCLILNSFPRPFQELSFYFLVNFLEGKQREVLDLHSLSCSF